MLNFILLAGIVVLAVLLLAGSGINPDVLFYATLALAALYGILFVMPIGGADMPVVISLLNSFTGVAAACGGLRGASAAGGGATCCPASGGGAVGGSAVMMLTGGIDAAEIVALDLRQFGDCLGFSLGNCGIDRRVIFVHYPARLVGPGEGILPAANRGSDEPP